ncbi:hypothetical protein [Helicobacter sp. T3_23-1056]
MRYDLADIAKSHCCHNCERLESIFMQNLARGNLCYLAKFCNILQVLALLRKSL